MEPPRIIRKQATEDRDSSDVDEDIPEEDEEQDEDEEEDSTDSRGRRVQQFEEKEESEDEISLDDLDVNPEPARGLNIPTMGRGVSRSMSSASNVKSQAVSATKIRHDDNNDKGMDISDITRKKAERDLCDLQEMINRHFEQRKQEEVELNNLK